MEVKCEQKIFAIMKWKMLFLALHVSVALLRSSTLALLYRCALRPARKRWYTAVLCFAGSNNKWQTEVRDWPYIYLTENFACMCTSIRIEVTSGVVCLYRVMRGGGGSYRYTSLCHRKWLSFTAEVSWRESCELINEASQYAGHSSACVVLMANRILTTAPE